MDYIDSPPLRQHVQRARNRGESAQQLRRAVLYANFGKLRCKTAQEPQLWGACARLLTHRILSYPMGLFSPLAAHKERAGDVPGAALRAHVSPVAWQHINFYGHYEFRTTPAVVNLEELVRLLANIAVPPDCAESC